jgi:hypothetical protein
MNRQQRRAVQARSKKIPLNPIVAFHEAGHAVGRYITAADMGLSVDNAIAFIDVAPGTSLGSSLDKTMQFTSQAVTFGPAFSVPIQAVLSRECGDLRSLEFKDVVRAVAIASAEGADISKWLNAKALIAVFGPAAEAVITRKSFEEVLHSYECEGDLRDLVRDCTYAGLESSEIQSMIDDAAKKCVSLIQRPEICAAINALAKQLPNAGRMKGQDAVAIIGRAIGGRAGSGA